MNKSSKFPFKYNIHILLRPQSQNFCKKKQVFDKVGPADPISNLHLVKYAVPENETPIERKLRKYREDLQDWNQLFWTKHNLTFIKKKKEFQDSALKKKPIASKNLNADEMSVFFKDFLDKNWKTHLDYLFEWYKRHACVTFLHFRVEMQKFFKKSM